MSERPPASQSTMTRRDFLAAAGIGMAGMALLGCQDRSAARSHGKAPRVLVIGIDGMDYRLTCELMDRRLLPHFVALAEQGTFRPLGTSMPPLSPVAWSCFITGTNPGQHGIFDFLRRDPSRVGSGFALEDAVTSRPQTSADDDKGWSVPGTDYVVRSVASPRVRRNGTPFWEILESCGHPTTLYKIPAVFPVTPSPARVLAGLGVPDVEGTYGMFTWITDQSDDWSRRLTGGYLRRATVTDGQVRVIDEQGQPTRPWLVGPMNLFLQEPRRCRVSFDCYVDRRRKTAVIRIADREIVLGEGRWSPWVEIAFDLMPTVASVRGLARFYCQNASDAIRLYVSPIHLAPGTEGLASGGLDNDLAAALGPFYTKGMSEETKALTAGIFSPQEYLTQSDMVFAERLAGAEHLVSTWSKGLLFIYFSTLDLDSHVLWKYHDKAHPAHRQVDLRLTKDAVIDRYVKMDDMLGHLQSLLRPSDIIYVMSDHGFAPLRREFNLVTWLWEEGYLAYTSPIKARLSTMYSDVDWERTRAYGVGFNGLFINLKGREAVATVDPRDRAGLAEEIRHKLLALKDIDDQPVFEQVYRREDIYSGDRLDEAPDLILGYAIGYGPSDDAVMGTWGEQVLAPRVVGFTGQHVVDHSLADGVLFSSRRLIDGATRLEDVSATLLAEFGAPVPAAMSGRPLI